MMTMMMMMIKMFAGSPKESEAKTMILTEKKDII